MKKIWSTCALLILAIGVCCFSLFYTIQAADKATETVLDIQKNVSDQNYKEALDKNEKLNEFWKYNHVILSMIVHHEILEGIEETISLMYTALSMPKEEISQFWLESTRVLIRLDSLRDLEIPSIDNIL